MAVELKPKLDKMYIDIDGPNGNAFYLMAVARDFSKTLDLDEREVQSGYSERPFEYLAIEKRFSTLLFSEQPSTEFHLFLWDYSHHRYRSVETICISADLMFDNYDEIHDKVVENYNKRKEEELKNLGVHPGQIAYYE